MHTSTPLRGGPAHHQQDGVAAGQRTVPVVHRSRKRPRPAGGFAPHRRQAPQSFLSPLSSRFDELDSMVWLEDVFIPRPRVFTAEPINRNTRHSLVSWLLWHHSYGWLAKAELTLSIALALAEVMGLKDNPQTAEQIVELTVNVQTTPHLHGGGGTGTGDDGWRPCPAQPASRGVRRNQHSAGPPAHG